MNQNKMQVVAANYDVNNDHDESRTHRISASVRCGRNGEVESINNGVVTSTADGRQLANFNFNLGGNLNVNFMATTAEQMTTLNVINDFIAAARADEEGGEV